MQLVSYLSSLDRDISANIAKIAPEILAQTGTEITTTKANNAAGYALQAGAIRYFDFTYVSADTEYHRSIRMVPLHQQDQAPGHPSGVVLRDNFIPCDPLNRRWDGVSDDRTFFNGDGEVVRYRYVANPAALTGPTSSLTSPDFARPFFERSLATLIMSLNAAPVAMIQMSATIEERMRRQLGLTIHTYAEKKTAWGQVSELDEWRYF
jgi:hypothetical protein